jgi:hypothetical protein
MPVIVTEVLRGFILDCNFETGHGHFIHSPFYTDCGTETGDF